MTGRSPGALRLLVRLEESERVWLAIAAEPGTPVEVHAPDGRQVVGEDLGNVGEGRRLWRFARLDGSGAAEGLGRDNIRVAAELDNAPVSLEVAFKTRPRLLIAVSLAEATAFHGAFGPLSEGTPAPPHVYRRWRLP